MSFYDRRTTWLTPCGFTYSKADPLRDKDTLSERTRTIMKIIKRNGSEAEFDKNKIIRAISKANITVDESTASPRAWCCPVSASAVPPASRKYRTWSNTR